MKVYEDLIQGTEEWIMMRKGRPSASRASEIITAEKGDLSKSAQKYIFALIADCFSPDDDFPAFQSSAMKRGIEMEPVARDAFRAQTGLSVKEVGIILSDDNVCACSPDGLIRGENGDWSAGLEIKCPTKEKHVEYVLSGTLPSEYKQQVHWSLALTGFKEWHFYSFHPRLKPLHLIVQSDEYTEKVAAAIKTFSKQYLEATAIAKEKLMIPENLKD